LWVCAVGGVAGFAHVVVILWIVAAGVSSCRAAVFSWCMSVLAWSLPVRYLSSPVGVDGLDVGMLFCLVLVGYPGWLFCSSVMAVCSWSVIWVSRVMVVWMLMMVWWLVILAFQNGLNGSMGWGVVTAPFGLAQLGVDGVF